MNKLTTVVLGLGLAALPVLGASPAFADERDCNRAQREVTRVELRLAGLVTEERNAEQAALRAAQDALDAAQAALRAANPATDALRAAVDTAREARDAARNALNTDSRRLADLRAELKVAVDVRDKACAPDPTPTPTPAPTTTPAPPADVDCDEVSDREAQAILDRDKHDPHDLDTDGDGVACEEQIAPKRDVVVVPSGGVNTGGGPA